MYQLNPHINILVIMIIKETGSMKNAFNEQCITYSQMNMISNSRLFWRRFTTWIRIFIISRYIGIGTEESAFSRLYFETSGVGSLLQIIFDRQTANQISLLLNQFTFALRDLITAQFQHNTEAVTQNVNRLYQISRNFAAFLHSVNPYIDETEWRNMMNTYIQYTIEEANSFMTGNYSNDIELYGRLTDLTDRMGDVLADSLNSYINSGLSVTPQSDTQCVTYEQMNQIYIIKMLWYELFNWTRAYMLSRYRGIGNSAEVRARLEQVPTKYTQQIHQIFGVDPEVYIELFNIYINLVDNLITAQLEGDVNAINQTVQLLYQNADQRAEFIASINPDWSTTVWRDALYTNLRNTIDESTSFLTGDYDRSLDIFRTLLDQAEDVSSYFAQGVFNYLITKPKTSNKNSLCRNSQ